MIIRTFSIKEDKDFGTTPESKDRMRATNLWLPGHGVGDAVDRARSMADKITDKDKIIRRLTAVYEEAKANHPDELSLVMYPFCEKARKLGVYNLIPAEILSDVYYGTKAASKSFGLREPGFYKVKADNSRIDVEIAEIKSDIAFKKIRLAQLNEAKKKSTNKDLFIDQMAAVRDDINRLQNNIEKLKGRYKEYKEI